MASNNSFQHMKKSSLLVLIVLVFVDFAPAQIPERSNLRIMTYNIWNGFDWGKDSIRKESTIEWIKSQKPDVLALQELCNYTEEKLKEDALKWGHQHVQLLKTEGYPTALTSNRPISLKERIDYILASPELALWCKKVEIFNQEETHMLSDHYPMMAEFKIILK